MDAVESSSSTVPFPVTSNQSYRINDTAYLLRYREAQYSVLISCETIRRRTVFGKELGSLEEGEKLEI
jgi:hypothetical protein